MTQCEIPPSLALNSDPTPTGVRPDRGVFISTYGCQMNVNDSERMMSLMEMANFTPVDRPEDASVIIINACSVREKPVQKVYSEVGLYRKLKKENPFLRIGVAGCVGQQEKENLIKNQPLIDFVFGTDNIDELPLIVARLYEEDGPGKAVEARFKHREPYHVETLVRNPGVSTFVNIMKGCDNFCSFCIVPFTRGREKSRPLQHVLTDVRHLVKRGVREVTLLGQNVNSYRDDDMDFADLLAAVATQTDIQRIRYTTSHPKDFNEKLVETMAKHQNKICEYIHLPFQSGNTDVLARMNRGYSREDYLRKIEMIKKGLPDVVLSTDIIVGFPGETEEQFNDTVSLVEEVAFETMFAFKYSPRPFTKAARFEDQVDEDAKQSRLVRLIEAHETQAFEIVKKYEGQVLEVLVDRAEDATGKVSGRSTQNKNVHFLGSSADIGKLVPVRVMKAFPNVLRGERVMS
ncbi:MAG: tRNA (N6-isopentenyl adenosine(37)-C2)-methylthiotransferase MiaB [Bdellovibrionaceae bacterium]|nr:tRNA (N6-isopentenyl adenosine(37)-C2)-methylthiotransferase MiaB [Pseudobdellovibrionaceae bacterium]MBX3035041.1 tRNA (N6-isopentenyl adenosine(37)-C2)-methylthiotransferase MiaB [Pseudobdellovibrionaceae bacterium]